MAWLNTGALDLQAGLRAAALCGCVVALGCGGDSTSDAGSRGQGGGTGAMEFGNAGDDIGNGAFGNPNGGVSGGGAVGGDGSGGEADDGCPKVDVKPQATFSPGNLMVLFDRSVSMDDPFNNTSRLEAAKAALLSAIEPFTCDGPVSADGPNCSDVLTVASILFPSTAVPPDIANFLCTEVQPLSGAEQLPWMKSTDFVNAWNGYWQSRMTVLGTPISPAFMHAAAAIDEAQTQAMLEGNYAVLFLTDGGGTCDGGAAGLTQATAWAAAGIPTYVVNMDNSGGGGFGANAAYNDMVAAAGGTVTSINPADQAALDAAMAMVLQATAKVESCELTLNGKIDDVDGACENGDVLLGPRKLECSDTDGYQFTGPDTIELVGPACDELMAGGFLNAKFPCDVFLQ